MFQLKEKKNDPFLEKKLGGSIDHLASLLAPPLTRLTQQSSDNYMSSPIYSFKYPWKFRLYIDPNMYYLKFEYFNGGQVPSVGQAPKSYVNTVQLAFCNFDQFKAHLLQ